MEARSEGAAMQFSWRSLEDFSSASTSSLLLGLAVLLVLTRRSLWSRANELVTSSLSIVINWILCFRYPIKHIHDKQQLPTCPYQWPNGQGDVAKFLEGLKNRHSWASSYGSVYRIWSGTNPEIVLTKPSHLQEVFRDSNKHIKAPNNNSGYFLGAILGQCLGLISGQRWRSLKSAVDEPFAHVRMKDYVDAVLQKTESYLTSPEMHSKLTTGRVDPVSDFKMLPFWVIVDLLYGPLDPSLKAHLDSLIETREDLFRRAIQGGLVRFSFSAYLPLRATRQLRAFKSAWADFNHAARTHPTSSPTSPAAQMFRAVQEGHGTEEQLLQTLDEMIFANLDVTMGAVSWVLVLLAQHADVQERLLREIGSHEDEREAYVLRSSTLLAACVLEAARLRPLAAFSVPQAAPSERVLDGFVVPGGTSFIVDTYALNMDEGFWGEDAGVFRPERFLEKSGVSTRYNYWRFGFGPRQCLGKHVADLMIRSLLVCLLPTWRLSDPKGDEERERVKGTWINHPQGEIELRRRTLVC